MGHHVDHSTPVGPASLRFRRQHAEMGGCHFWQKRLRPGSQSSRKPKTRHPRCSLVKHEQSRMCLQNPRQHNPSQESALACGKKESPQIQLQVQACQPVLYRQSGHPTYVGSPHIKFSSGQDVTHPQSYHAWEPAWACCLQGGQSERPRLKNRDSSGGDETFFLFQLPRHSVSTH